MNKKHSTPNQATTRKNLVFPQNLVFEFESIWMILAKVCYWNCISFRELQQLERRNEPHIKALAASADFIDVFVTYSKQSIVKEKFLEERLNLTSRQIYWANTENYVPPLLFHNRWVYQNPDYYQQYRSPSRTNLSYCKSCLESGYHSPIHQMKYLELCPIHSEPLRQAGELPYNLRALAFNPKGADSQASLEFLKLIGSRLDAILRRPPVSVPDTRLIESFLNSYSLDSESHLHWLKSENVATCTSSYSSLPPIRFIHDLNHQINQEIKRKPSNNKIEALQENLIQVPEEYPDISKEYLAIISKLTDRENKSSCPLSLFVNNFNVYKISISACTEKSHDLPKYRSELSLFSILKTSFDGLIKYWEKSSKLSFDISVEKDILETSNYLFATSQKTSLSSLLLGFSGQSFNDVSRHFSMPYVRSNLLKQAALELNNINSVIKSPYGETFTLDTERFYFATEDRWDDFDVQSQSFWSRSSLNTTQTDRHLEPDQLFNILADSLRLVYSYFCQYELTGRFIYSWLLEAERLQVLENLEEFADMFDASRISISAPSMLKDDCPASWLPMATDNQEAPAKSKQGYVLHNIYLVTPSWMTIETMACGWPFFNQHTAQVLNGIKIKLTKLSEQ